MEVKIRLYSSQTSIFPPRLKWNLLVFDIFRWLSHVSFNSLFCLRMRSKLWVCGIYEWYLESTQYYYFLIAVKISMSSWQNGKSRTLWLTPNQPWEYQSNILEYNSAPCANFIQSIQQCGGIKCDRILQRKTGNIIWPV